jgi:SAM-dependent methyltransferase
MSSYEERLRTELENYRAVENVNDLPGIFHYWSAKHLTPMLTEIGIESFDDLFLDYCVVACECTDEAEFISIGAGNCDFEVALAGRLVERGHENFRFRCLDINPHMLERGRVAALATGLERHVLPLHADIIGWEVDRHYDVVIASHSLHHFVELEVLFEKIAVAIGGGGVFLVNDMVGRNGHMRWPEALEVMERIWKTLPERYKYNHQLKRLEHDYVNWDCSDSGFEGIRAQDILPLLMEHFQFEVFLAFANVVNVFVDRSFGHNFDPSDPADQALIDRIAELDDCLLDEGVIKPVQLIAAMRVEQPEQQRWYRNRTPQHCVRVPDSESADRPRAL